MFNIFNRLRSLFASYGLIGVIATVTVVSGYTGYRIATRDKRRSAELEELDRENRELSAELARLQAGIEEHVTTVVSTKVAATTAMRSLVDSSEALEALSLHSLPEQIIPVGSTRQSHDLGADSPNGLLQSIDLNRPIFYLPKFKSTVTPLQLAAHLGQQENIKGLLLRGVDINALSQEGAERWLQWVVKIVTLGLITREGKFTALHLAVKAEHLECVKILLASGADYKIKDTRGKLPLTLRQLCTSLSISERLTKLDLSIYKNIKQSDLDLISTALSTSRLSSIAINLPDIHFSSGYFSSRYNIELLLSLIDVLNRYRLQEILLNVLYVYNTSCSSVFFNGTTTSDVDLIEMRENCTRIIDALTSLAEKHPLTKVVLGTVIREHRRTYQKRETFMKSVTEYKHNFITGKYGSISELKLVTENVTYTDTTRKTLFTLDDPFFLVCVSDIDQFNRELAIINSEVSTELRSGIVWSKPSSRGLLDERTYRASCLKFVETLRLQHAAVRTCAVSRVLLLSPARAAIGCSDRVEELPEVGTQSCRM